MKKRVLVVGMVFALAASALTACGGSSKENYLSDVQAINDFGVAVQEMEEIADYAEAVAGMDMKTEEGKVLKEDMEELGECLEQLSAMMEDLENYDETAAAELQEKMTDLQTKVEEHVEDFTDAAEKSGVDDEDLEGMDLDF